MIEWFLQPKTENEALVSHAMKLYGAGQLTDMALNYYLQRSDKSIDRKLKELQLRKLAREEGLDWERYMSDDAADEGKTAQAALAYGAAPLKPKISAARVPFRGMNPQEIASLDRGPVAMAKNVASAFGLEGSVSELMRKVKAGNLKPAITKLVSSATIL